MGRKKIAGLFKKKDVYHIDKYISGKRVCKSTGTGSLIEAEKFLVKLMEDTRQAEIYGTRPKRTFQQAADHYIKVRKDKKSIDSDISRLTTLLPMVGDQYIDEMHIGTLQDWIAFRHEQGRKCNTINHGLKMVRQILNCAASEWIDQHRLTWLLQAPKIKLLNVTDESPAYPITWEEQEKLFELLPAHLNDMALFAVNTGCRDQEICHLRWEMEIEVPQLNTSIFFLPKEMTKGKRNRVVVLNKIEKEVVDRRREIDSKFVFSFQGRGLYQMNNSGWRSAREQINLPFLRVHDLKHTFGCRLRAAGVSFEDRQDLLGHKSSRMTTHYSAAELTNMIEAANKVCADENGEMPGLVILRLPAFDQSRKIPEGKKKGYAKMA
ncbi:MAG: site-specific integrase [Methylophaga sp.]|nr:site-specific integrase [Methylophaga sp.]